MLAEEINKVKTRKFASCLHSERKTERGKFNLRVKLKRGNWV
jgi:hypothetical protein